MTSRVKEISRSLAPRLIFIQVYLHNISVHSSTYLLFKHNTDVSDAVQCESGSEVRSSFRQHGRFFELHHRRLL
jgi:hypothetical protein